MTEAVWVVSESVTPSGSSEPTWRVVGVHADPASAQKQVESLCEWLLDLEEFNEGSGSRYWCDDNGWVQFQVDVVGA